MTEETIYHLKAMGQHFDIDAKSVNFYIAQVKLSAQRAVFKPMQKRIKPVHR